MEHRGELEGRVLSRLARDRGGDAAPVPDHHLAARFFGPPACDGVRPGTQAQNERFRLEVDSKPQFVRTLPSSTSFTPPPNAAPLGQPERFNTKRHAAP